MKARIEEFDSGFCFTLTADTAEDVAQLVRFGANRVLVVKYADTFVHKGGHVFAMLSIGKRKHPRDLVQQPHGSA